MLSRRGSDEARTASMLHSVHTVRRQDHQIRVAQPIRPGRVYLVLSKQCAYLLLPEHLLATNVSASSTHTKKAAQV